jgi:hypothetical protein
MHRWFGVAPSINDAASHSDGNCQEDTCEQCRGAVAALPCLLYRMHNLVETYSQERRRHLLFGGLFAAAFRSGVNGNLLLLLLPGKHTVRPDFEAHGQWKALAPQYEAKTLWYLNVLGNQGVRPSVS